MSEVLLPLPKGKAVLPTLILASSPHRTPPSKPGLVSSLHFAWSSASFLSGQNEEPNPSCPCLPLLHPQRDDCSVLWAPSYGPAHL